MLHATAGCWSDRLSCGYLPRSRIPAGQEKKRNDLHDHHHIAATAARRTASAYIDVVKGENVKVNGLWNMRRLTNTDYQTLSTGVRVGWVRGQAMLDEVAYSGCSIESFAQWMGAMTVGQSGV